MLTTRPALVRIACIALAAAVLAAFAVLSQDPAFDIAEPVTAAAAGAGVLVLAALAYVVARTGRRRAPAAADSYVEDDEPFDEQGHSTWTGVDAEAEPSFTPPATVATVVVEPALVADEQPAPVPVGAVVVEPTPVADDEPAAEPDLEPPATADEPTDETEVDPALVVLQAQAATHRAAVLVDGPTAASPRVSEPSPAGLPVAAAAEPFRAPTLADAEALAPSHERALQLHIRALEAALEEQSARLAQSQLHETSQPGRDMERVLLTIGALRDRMQTSPGSESLLNRVEAAVARLALTAAPARPALPALIPVERRAVAAPPQPASVTVAAPVVPPETQAALSLEPLPAVEEVSPAPALVQVSLEPLPAEIGLAPLPAVGLAPVPAQVSIAPLPATVSDVGYPAPAATAEPALASLPLEAVEAAHTPPAPAFTPHIEERVLPVPPPAAPPARHGGRWRRRRAA